jgi:hypothetical protein
LINFETLALKKILFATKQLSHSQAALFAQLYFRIWNYEEIRVNTTNEMLSLCSLGKEIDLKVLGQFYDPRARLILY